MFLDEKKTPDFYEQNNIYWEVGENGAFGKSYYVSK